MTQWCKCGHSKREVFGLEENEEDWSEEEEGEEEWDDEEGA